MKTAEEILKPFVEVILRHTEIVEKDNALLAMQRFADQFRNFTWISVLDQAPPDYERVLYCDDRHKIVSVGFFVWSQTPVDYVKYWMFLPAIKY